MRFITFLQRNAAGLGVQGADGQFHGLLESDPAYPGNLDALIRKGPEALARAAATLSKGPKVDLGQLKGRGIRVNVVAPGAVVTPAYKTELKLSEEHIEAYRQEIAEKAPLGRVGDADEIAKAVSFLASDDASYITGIELFVDGGLVQV
jgi:hypothetical protein